jgi:hypothetical protein
MLASLFALSLANAATAQPKALDRLLAAPSLAPIAATAVVLDCQVAARSLVDCKAVNDSFDGAMVAEAIRMAAAIVVPEGLSDSGVGRIKVRMKVTP